MIDVVCTVTSKEWSKDADKDKNSSKVIVRSAHEQNAHYMFTVVVEIEINGEKCFVDASEIIDAINKCASAATIENLVSSKAAHCEKVSDDH